MRSNVVRSNVIRSNVIRSNVIPLHTMDASDGVDAYLCSLLNSALNRSEWLRMEPKFRLYALQNYSGGQACYFIAKCVANHFRSPAPLVHLAWLSRQSGLDSRVTGGNWCMLLRWVLICSLYNFLLRYVMCWAFFK